MAVMDKMDQKAIAIVRYYCKGRHAVNYQDFDAFIVWKAKVLQNWKYLIGTSIMDGLYYEVIYDGFRDFWYLDVYERRENSRFMDLTVEAEILRKVEQ